MADEMVEGGPEEGGAGCADLARVLI